MEDFDIAEFLYLLTRRVSELLDVAEVGILLVNDGVLEVMASSTEGAWNVELFQLYSDEGPCIECFRTGTAVIVEDLHTKRERWRSYVPAALAAGFASVLALPLRLRRDRIGVLGLLGTSPGRLGESDLLAVQAMADVATISILQHQTLRQTLTTKDHLQSALSTRVATRCRGPRTDDPKRRGATDGVVPASGFDDVTTLASFVAAWSELT